ncbi:MAG: ExbD/TolR family protein [Pirellulales bacterium]
MKLRRTTSSAPDKVEMQMTPMIDIVFQLLIFFLFSFKIVAIEGDFNIRMPVAGPGTPNLEAQLPIKIKLSADAEGDLTGIQMADRPLPSFAALHEQVMSIVGTDAGPNAAAANTEAELDCDFNLKYRYVINAITAISGYVTPDGHIVKLIQKIKFAPPKKPA